MPCEHYKDALIEAAARGAQPQGDLRAHLHVCASCRAAFAQEQSLFASIDAGLHATANGDLPAALTPRVRARLDEVAVPQRRWFQPFVLAAASVALAFAIFQFARTLHFGRDNQAKQTPQIEAPATNAGLQNSGPGTRIVSSNRSNFKTRGNSTLFRPVASSQPEVLVPPDEREALARFIVVLQERREVVVALVTRTMPTKDESASFEPLQINGLEIKPLAGAEPEQSDGAGQKQ